MQPQDALQQGGPGLDDEAVLTVGAVAGEAAAAIIQRMTITLI